MTINNRAIDKIRLENFKCYSDQEFELAQLTIYCGANSVGKSSAIQALLILLQSGFRQTVHFNGSLISLGQYRKDVLKHIRKGALKHNSEEREERVSIELSTKEKVYNWSYDPELDALSLLGEGDQSQLQNATSLFQYIQAERLGPEDNYRNREESYHPNWLGKKGEFTSEIITGIDAAKIEYRRLNENDLRLYKGIEGVRISDHIRAWMQEISPKVKVSSYTNQEANISFNTFSDNGGEEIKAKNMGFGMSYSLGVVSALLITPPGQLVIIENPEAHLHPRAQSYIGRLIALTALAGVQVILETHSDHLLNGVRVISRLYAQYKEGDFCVYFIDKDEQNNTKANKLSLGENGELPDWPDGFFDQQIKDLGIIISGKE